MAIMVVAEGMVKRRNHVACYISLEKAAAASWSHSLISVCEPRKKKRKNEGRRASGRKMKKREKKKKAKTMPHISCKYEKKLYLNVMKRHHTCLDGKRKQIVAKKKRAGVGAARRRLWREKRQQRHGGRGARIAAASTIITAWRRHLIPV